MKSDEEKFEEMRANLRYLDNKMSEMRHEIDSLRKENKELKEDKKRLEKLIVILTKSKDK